MEPETPGAPAGCPAAPAAMLPAHTGWANATTAAALEPKGRSSPGKVAGEGTRNTLMWEGRTVQILLRQQQPGTRHPVPPSGSRGGCTPSSVRTHLCGAASPGRAGRPLLPAGRRGRGAAGGSEAAAGGRPRRRRRERSRGREAPSRGSVRSSGTCSQRDGAGPAGIEGHRQGSAARLLPRPPRGRAYTGGGAPAGAYIGHYHPHSRGRDKVQTNSPGTAARTPSPPAETGGATLPATVPRLPLPLAEDAAVGRTLSAASPASPIAARSGAARRLLPAGDVSEGRPVLPGTSRHHGCAAPPGRELRGSALPGARTLLHRPLHR